MINDRRIGQLLQFYRRLRNKTIEEIAFDTQISESTIKRIEAGNNALKLNTLNILCLHLNIDIIRLLDDSLDEEIIIFEENLNLIEKKIRHYNFNLIDKDVANLIEYADSTSIKINYDINPIIDFYNYLIAFDNNEINNVHRDLNKIVKSIDSSIISPKFEKYVSNERYKILFALTCSSIGDFDKAINIQKEIIATSNSPLTISKARVNLAKLYYAKKDYRSAYECTLETIHYLYRHSITDRLQAAFWMKGICELELNLEFKRSIETAVNSAHYCGLVNQHKIFKNHAREHFGMEIEPQTSQI